MKNIGLLFAAICLVFTANATKWRINNNAGIDANFSDIQSAIDSAAAGDTLYIEGSAVSYAAFTCTKQLYFFGPGYFLSENDSTQANLSPTSISGTNYFNAGSAGSLVSGISFTDYVYIQENNITIKRNKIVGKGIYITGNASNIMILQNYIHCNYSSGGYSCVDVATGSSNIFIQNNILKRHSVSYDAIAITGTSSAQIDNNIILIGGIDAVNSTLTNNIMDGAAVSCASCTIQNNIGNSTQFGTANGNMENIDITSVFDSTKTTTDSQYMLDPASVAIGAGQFGVDCGIFGGNDPYVLSGLPALPSIFYFSAPSSGSASSGLPVNIKIKANQ